MQGMQNQQEAHEATAPQQHETTHAAAVHMPEGAHEAAADGTPDLPNGLHAQMPDTMQQAPDATHAEQQQHQPAAQAHQMETHQSEMHQHQPSPQRQPQQQQMFQQQPGQQHPQLQLVPPEAAQPSVLQPLPPAGMYLPHQQHRGATPHVLPAQVRPASTELQPRRPRGGPGAQQASTAALLDSSATGGLTEEQLRAAQPIPVEQREHLVLHLPPLQYARYISPAPAGLPALQADGQAAAASESAAVQHAAAGGAAAGQTQMHSDARLGVGAVPMKKSRAKKPAGAPTRPRSPYMFFLADFREQFKKDHPQVTKVADMARAAGEAWRAIPPEAKAVYEVKSAENKAQYAEAIAAFKAANPQPERPSQAAATQRRPQSSYALFMADYKRQYKAEHPGDAAPARVVTQLANEAWAAMPADNRAGYEERAQASRAEMERASHNQAAAAAAEGGLTAEEVEELGTLDVAGGGACIIEELPMDSPALAGLPHAPDVPQVSDASTAAAASGEAISFGPPTGEGGYGQQGM